MNALQRPLRSCIVEKIGGSKQHERSSAPARERMREHLRMISSRGKIKNILNPRQTEPSNQWRWLIRNFRNEFDDKILSSSIGWLNVVKKHQQNLLVLIEKKNRPNCVQFKKVSQSDFFVLQSTVENTRFNRYTHAPT